LNRPLRIFYVIGTLDVGGAEGQLVQLLKGLDRARFSATVCCLSSAGGPYAEEVRRLGIAVHEIGFRGLRIFRYPHRVIAQLAHLVSLIRRERPDVVHGFLFWAYVLGTFAARAAGVGVVISSRRSLGFFKEDKPLYQLLERLSNAMTTSVVANSEAVRADAIRQEKLAPEKVVVIHNGVEIAESPAADIIARLRGELRLEGAQPVVTVIANFLSYKGHGSFFEAWRRVAAAHPSAVAVLVGDGPERARWERWIADEKMSPTVRFVGSRRDVPAILAVTDIVAHPSLQEGFSNAVLEAMASARPVVATTVGGNPEAIEDGRTGLLVPARDAAALARAIMYLAADPERARQIGGAARTRVARCFSPRRMVEDYEDLYERLIAGGPVYVSPRVPCTDA